MKREKGFVIEKFPDVSEIRAAIWGLAKYTRLKKAHQKNPTLKKN